MYIPITLLFVSATVFVSMPHLTLYSSLTPFSACISYKVSLYLESELKHQHVGERGRRAGVEWSEGDK